MTIVLLCDTTLREDVKSDRFQRGATLGLSTLDAPYQGSLDTKTSPESRMQGSYLHSHVFRV